VNTALHLRATTSSVAETRAYAAALATLLRDGDLLLLVGDLGAGKTAFTQGLGAALDVDGAVTSPTFTLANRYEGRLVVNHLDVYRLGALAEAEDLALSELLDDGVTVIEWGDTIEAVLPADRLRIGITFGPGDDDRVIDCHPVGDRWTERVDDIRAAVADWLTP
jgi:tRNA threonylcarbamoyladenosine biosynthesis protein TsaE